MGDVADDEVEAIKAAIRAAFVTAARPANGSLHTSEQSDEASTLLEADFADKADWRTLPASFVDQAPAGFGSALSFLSPPAFRYFLPAYLIADLDDELNRADPVFHLTHGLTDATQAEPVRVAGGNRDETWLDIAVHRYDRFTREEAAAIVRYLEHRASTDAFARDDIDQALARYWRARAT